MKRPAVVRIPSRAEDEPRAVRVLSLACAGLALGLALSALVRGRSTEGAAPSAMPSAMPAHDREPEAPARRRLDETQAASDAAQPSAASLDAAVAHVAPHEAQSEPARATPTPPPSPTPPPPPTPPQAPTETARPSLTTNAEATSGRRASPALRFERGIVAYVRCEGLERKDTRFPCPRDRELEASVFATLSELTKCGEPDLGRGQGEVRLEWRGTSVPTILVRSSRDEPALSEQAVSRCVATPLNAARPKLHSSHLIVAFRFALR